MGSGPWCRPVTVGARGIWLDLKDRVPLHDALALTLSLQLSRQYPWQVRGCGLPRCTWTDTVIGQAPARCSGGSRSLDSRWSPASRARCTTGTRRTSAGGEGLEVSHDDGYFRTGGRLRGGALRGHGRPTCRPGARYEYHSAVTGSFVPRIALTRVQGSFHLKLLYAHAYRTPGYGNMVLSNGAIRPERTEVAEAEVGWKFDDNLFVAANVYDIRLRTPIVFTSDPVTFVDEYRNGPQMGSRGVEITAQLKRARTSWTLGYSFYSVKGRNAIDLYAVPGHSALARAFPQHKLTATGTFDLGPVRIGPSLVLTSDRYAERSGDGAGAGVVGNDGPLKLVNLQATWRNFAVTGLNLGVGIHNVLDARNSHLYPYIDHAPMPGQPREVALVLTWQDPG